MKAYEEAKVNFKGVVTVVLTPFKSNFEVDYEKLTEHLEWLVKKGIVKGRAAMIVSGACGEGPFLTTEETNRIAQTSVEAVGSKVPIFVGVHGRMSTREALKIVKNAERVGAVGAQIAPVYYFPPNSAELFNYYKTINDATDLGLEVYNTWYLGAPDMGAEFFQKVLGLRHVIAMKWSSRSNVNTINMMRLYADKITFIDNDTPGTGPLLPMLGARGFISILANFVPEVELRIWSLLQKKEFAKMLKEILEFHTPLYAWKSEPEQATIGEAEPYKTGMEIIGRPLGSVRPPQLPLSKPQKAVMRKLMSDAGLL